MRKVLTVGTFDLLHSGHIQLFRNCRNIAGIDGEVVVGINSDEFVLKYKKVNPVMPYKERQAVISQLKDVSAVVKNDSSNLTSMLKTISPNFLVVGSDWAKKDYFSQIGVDLEWLYKNNILLLYTEYTSNISSSLIKNNINLN